MSETTETLRRKIGTAGDLQSVVRTMKALAASSVGQYERSVVALGDYHRAVELGLGACLRDCEPAAWREEGRVPAGRGASAVVVFGSDQGLVGRFNEAVADEAMKTLASVPGRTRVWAVGERVRARLVEMGVPPVGVFAVPGSVKAIPPLIGQILLDSATSHGPGELTELHVFYNRSAPGAAYAPAHQRVLPLDEEWRRKLAGLPWPTNRVPEILGGAAATLRAFVREYLFVSLFRACAESLASENASRLAAMERADKNIAELLETLHDAFHRVRQSGIDEELFEVVSGFEALSMHDARPTKTTI